jgi:3-oxoacyl-[acyl-carrier protein] reductase
MDIGVTSVFIFTKELMTNLSSSSDSLVLNIGSGAGVIPMSGRSLYSSMKFALRGLTLSLAEEFKRMENPKFCLITLGSTLTSFGPMSFEEKKKDMESGKAYFTPEWVSDKLTEIIRDENREVEYTLYPGDYGFGEWHKPEPK